MLVSLATDIITQHSGGENGGLFLFKLLNILDIIESREVSFSSSMTVEILQHPSRPNSVLVPFLPLT